jgi:site-specific DNA-methyltransferase (adenine-specific)
MRYTLHHGDCLDVLKTLADCSVDAIVTDPPYGLSFMGKRWDYDVPTEAVWVECLRALKPGGHLLAFAGTRTQHRMAVRIEDAGFEIRDMIAWVYGSGFPKSLDVSKAIDKAAGAEREVVGTAFRSNAPGTVTNKVEWVRDVEYPITAPATEAAKQWEGWGTSIKPALEPITLARKPLIGTVAANVLEHGTGGLNIDGCRIEGKPPSVPQPVFNSPTGRTYGMKTGEGRNGEMSEASGRFPANFIHDGSEEVLALFPETGPAKASDRGPGKGKTGCFGVFGGDPGVRGHDDDGGSAARFFYCAKASRDDRDEGCGAFEEVEKRTRNSYGDQSEYDCPDGANRKGDKGTSLARNPHPTVKPTDLMRYLCRLITPPKGIVLDPFMGSGSTGKAAMAEGFRFIGIEREAEYIEIARARISAEADKPRQLSLF